MVKFHINKHGVPAPCRAKAGNCPLGGSEQHYNSEKEAEDAINKIHEKKFGTIHMIEADGDKIDKSDGLSENAISKAFPNLDRVQLQAMKKYCDLENNICIITNELKAERDKSTDEYFDKVQDLREMALDKYSAYGEVSQFLSDDDIDNYTSKFIPEPKPWKRDPNYNFHPEVSPSNFNYGMGKVISAYSGKSLNLIKKEINELGKERGLGLQESTREYWKTLEQRTDKPIISLDLETANPQDKSLTYDNGQLTYIIEFGAIKTHPDGRVEKLDFKSGILEEFEKRHGTGFQETHNISPDDIRGESQFTNDLVKQKEILEFLDNSVVIAHNAYFEDKQLTNSLRGWGRKVKEGNIELLDTMNFCKYLVPESERNTNEAFVQAAGMEYKGAHRAYQDAEMTLNAFNILKENR